MRGESDKLPLRFAVLFNTEGRAEREHGEKTEKKD